MVVLHPGPLFTQGTLDFFPCGQRPEILLNIGQKKKKSTDKFKDPIGFIQQFMIRAISPLMDSGTEWKDVIGRNWGRI